jgi:hypothetical protein
MHSLIVARAAEVDDKRRVLLLKRPSNLDMLKTYSRDAEAFVGHAGAGLLWMTLMDTCRDPAATEDRILVFDAFGPIGFVMKFAADDWES